MMNFYGSFELDVQIQKESAGAPWGFRLQGGAEYSLALMVEKVDPLGAAAQRLKPGDYILTINGKDTKGMSHEQAAHLISLSGTILSLGVKRPPPPPPASSSAPMTPFISNYAKAPVQTNYSTLPRNLRLLHGGSSTSSADDEDDNGDGGPKIPQNSQLAKLMRSQLAAVADGRPFRPSVVRQTKSAQNAYRHHTDLDLDVTQYLPKPPKRSQLTKQGSLGSPTPGLFDPYLSSQVRDSLLTRSPSAASHYSSDRSSPTTVVEMVGGSGPGGAGGGRRGHGTGEGGTTAVGVWTPPLHQPHAKLVHLQYNSPFDLYTPHNVADQIQKTTGTKLGAGLIHQCYSSWQKKPAVRFLEDIRDSPTYKFVHEIEDDGSGGPSSSQGRASSLQPPQSGIMRKLERCLVTDNDVSG